ncbi:hypothetical protein VTN02DRAFT_1544 [Thermoascus thermophilus]
MLQVSNLRSTQSTWRLSSRPDRIRILLHQPPGEESGKDRPQSFCIDPPFPSENLRGSIDSLQKTAWHVRMT